MATKTELIERIIGLEWKLYFANDRVETLERELKIAQQWNDVITKLLNELIDTYQPDLMTLTLNGAKIPVALSSELPTDGNL